MMWLIHSEPPHLDLRCLRIQLFSSAVVKKIIKRKWDPVVLNEVIIRETTSSVLLFFYVVFILLF